MAATLHRCPSGVYCYIYAWFRLLPCLHDLQWASGLPHATHADQKEQTSPSSTCATFFRRIRPRRCDSSCGKDCLSSKPCTSVVPPCALDQWELSIYSYFGIDREFRNTLYKCTMAMSAAWLIFFLCRTFERFFRKWSWVLMTLVLTQLLDLHLKPSQSRGGPRCHTYNHFCCRVLTGAQN